MFLGFILALPFLAPLALVLVLIVTAIVRSRRNQEERYLTETIPNNVHHISGRRTKSEPTPTVAPVQEEDHLLRDVLIAEAVGSALSSNDDSWDANPEPTAEFHGDGGEFGGAGASSSWDSGDTSSSSDSSSSDSSSSYDSGSSDSGSSDSGSSDY